jgi:23S rRNA pseudouridine2605 synthase
VGGPTLAEPALQRLRDGVRLDDGPTAPATVRRLGAHELEITLHEGRNRQVRRMCEAIGHPVKTLTRIRFGPLELGDLKPGAHRRLGAQDVTRLRDAVWKNRAP